jgi:hypothetical protein
LLTYWFVVECLGWLGDRETRLSRNCEAKVAEVLRVAIVKITGQTYMLSR